MKTKEDRLKNLTAFLKSVKAADIMTREVITTTKDASLSDVSEIMINKRISGLPVVNKSGKVIGMITANDLFMVMDMIKSGDVPFLEKKKRAMPTVEFAMSTGAHDIKKKTTLEEIIVLMRFRNAHTLPVMEGEKMVGVIGRRDVFKNFYALVKECFK